MGANGRDALGVIVGGAEAVLDVDAGAARGDDVIHVAQQLVARRGVALDDVERHGNRDRASDGTHDHEELIPGGLFVGIPEHRAHRGAGGRHGRKAEPFHEAGAGGVPGIRQEEEAVTLMQFTERLRFLLDSHGKMIAATCDIQHSSQPFSSWPAPGKRRRCRRR